MQSEATTTDSDRVGDTSYLWQWFADRAGALNSGSGAYDTAESIGMLASEGLLGAGVPRALGGGGGQLIEAVEAIAAVSARCMTSGFLLWCQRVFVEYLVQTGNPWLQENVLPKVLNGKWSGATGLSNAMKHLAGLERLRLEGSRDGERITLRGTLPWASNLRPERFFLAAAAQISPDRSIVVAIPSNVPGLTRSEDFQLLGLQSAWTASVQLSDVTLASEWIISDDAASFLPRVRPAFVLLQCGLALGLARRALSDSLGGNTLKSHILGPKLEAAQATLIELDAKVSSLATAASSDVGHLREIFQTRIALTRLAVQATQLELEVKGGSAYFAASDTARRLREVNFLPILTPSLVQLESELSRHQAVAREVVPTKAAV